MSITLNNVPIYTNKGKYFFVDITGVEQQGIGKRVSYKWNLLSVKDGAGRTIDFNIAQLLDTVKNTRKMDPIYAFQGEYKHSEAFKHRDEYEMKIHGEPFYINYRDTRGHLMEDEMTPQEKVFLLKEAKIKFVEDAIFNFQVRVSETNFKLHDDQMELSDSHQLI